MQNTCSHAYEPSNQICIESKFHSVMGNVNVTKTLAWKGTSQPGVQSLYLSERLNVPPSSS